MELLEAFNLVRRFPKTEGDVSFSGAAAATTTAIAAAAAAAAVTLVFVPFNYRPPFTNALKLTTRTTILLRELLATGVLSLFFGDRF